MNKNLVIGLAGGTASGKSTLAKKIHAQSHPSATVILRVDEYYKKLNQLFEEREKVNYDHPDAFDVDLLVHHIRQLKQGLSIQQPVYDYKNHNRTDETNTIKPAPVIILEGILILAIEAIRNEIDFKIFVETPTDIRLLRRIERDALERGRSFESVAKQYLATVRPMHDLFVEPSKVYANIIVPEGGYNEAATDLLLTKVASLVKDIK